MFLNKRAYSGPNRVRRLVHGSKEIWRGFKEKIVVFDDVGDYIWTSPNKLIKGSILVVAGGASGGSVFNHSSGAGGGGGAGGVSLVDTYNLIPNQDYPLKVGAGGNGVQHGLGNKGGDSFFGDIIAKGGGCGGYSAGSNPFVCDGGSGGGAGTSDPVYGAGGNAIQSLELYGGYGHNGGDTIGDVIAAGGGGGAGGVGQPNIDSDSGDGGLGIYLGDLFGEDVGDNGWFAAGGGGGSFSLESTPGSGRQGGSSAGVRDNYQRSLDAMTGTGSGSGGGASRSSESGHGGSGIIIVKFEEWL